jgi:hypothetical protein
MTLRTLTLATALVLGPLLAGCASDADALCDTRRRCINKDLNTGTCAEVIDTWLQEADTAARERRLEDCARCIDDLSCVEVRQRCTDACFDIPS